MKRSAVIIKKSNDGTRCIAIDIKNEMHLFSFLSSNSRTKKKFDHICELILGGHRNSELYDKEEFDSTIKNVSAMKILKGQENARIYCKEITNKQGVFIVVASELQPRKKTKKLSYKEKTLIRRVSNYEYEEIE